MLQRSKKWCGALGFMALFSIWQVVLAPASFAHDDPAAAEMLAPVPHAASGTYRLDRTHANLTWKVMHKGLAKYTARFTDFDATLEFDADDPAASELEVTVNPASVRTDYPQGKPYKFAKDEDFDAALAGENWFNADEFSEITFTSTGIERTGSNTGKITGDLTFMGITKPVTLDVTLNGAKSNPAQNSGALGFSAYTTLNRTDFGVSLYVPFIADQVEIFIEAEFYLDEE